MYVGADIYMRRSVWEKINSKKENTGFIRELT